MVRFDIFIMFEKENRTNKLKNTREKEKKRDCIARKINLEA